MRYTIDNSPIRYEQLVDKQPIKISDYVSAKLRNIHEQLYHEALAEYRQTLDDDSMYNFVEVPPKTFFEPSSVILVEKRAPFKKTKVSLKEWWDPYYFFDYHTVMHTLVSKYGTSNYEIVDINFVNGKVHLVDRITGNEFDMGFRNVTPSTIVSEDLVIDDTFTKLYNAY